MMPAYSEELTETIIILNYKAYLELWSIYPPGYITWGLLTPLSIHKIELPEHLFPNSFPLTLNQSTNHISQDNFVLKLTIIQ